MYRSPLRKRREHVQLATNKPRQGQHICLTHKDLGHYTRLAAHSACLTSEQNAWHSVRHNLIHWREIRLGNPVLPAKLIFIPERPNEAQKARPR